MKAVAAVVPVFDPDPGLIPLCRELVGRFALVLVVDDGSRDRQGEFARLPPSVTLLRHGRNRGKGRAIKTALNWLLENRKDVVTAVFVDGDGQHRADDAAAVAAKSSSTDAVALGVRDFGRAGTPLRNRFGNALTSWLVRRLFGFGIRDTQTGLRAYPRRLWNGLLELSGERYEYEMRLFGFLHRMGEPLETVPIATIYGPGDRASHFRPVADSVKIYRGLLGDAAGRWR